MSFLFNGVLKVLASAIRSESETIGIQIRKVCEEHNLEYRKSEGLYKKLFELINSAGLEGKKINGQKSIVFLDNCNEKPRKEIRTVIPCTKALKTVKYLGKVLSFFFCSFAVLGLHCSGQT